MNLVNSLTILSSCMSQRGYAVFRAACAVTDPVWTQGSDDPATWHAPADAAGGLCLWCDDGELDRVEPSRGSQEADEEAAASPAANGWYAYPDAVVEGAAVV
jgi:hypothetical protein